MSYHEYCLTAFNESLHTLQHKQYAKWRYVMTQQLWRHFLWHKQMQYDQLHNRRATCIYKLSFIRSELEQRLLNLTIVETELFLVQQCPGGVLLLLLGRKKTSVHMQPDLRQLNPGESKDIIVQKRMILPMIITAYWLQIGSIKSIIVDIWWLPCDLSFAWSDRSSLNLYQ